MNSKELGKHNSFIIIILIYAKQTMTPHQYNILIKDVMFEQNVYGLLWELCEDFSSKAQVSICRCLLTGRGFKVVQIVHIAPIGVHAGARL